MAELSSIIPLQSFELLGPKIAEILAIELANQSVLDTSFTPPKKIYLERVVPIADTEIPAINVCLIMGTYDRKSVKRVDGTYTYAIDIYTRAATTVLERGDTQAARQAQRIMGMCRAILENPSYKTLGALPPAIMHTNVTSFKTMDRGEDPDLLSNIAYRLIFMVEAPETVELKTGVPLGNATTKVILYNGPQGYYYALEPTD